MMIKEAIVLAGGLGTRLRDTVPDVPKCMAPINGKPFLGFIIEHLVKEGIEQFIFALGYMSEAVTTYLKDVYPELNYQVSLEDKPLGTGGAIKLACALSQEKSVLVVNGDTLFKINVLEVASFHTLSGAHCTLSLKYLENFDRYGVVEMDEDFAITSFKEKAAYKSGLINGGMYALNIHRFFEDEDLPEVFSFEKDYLEKHYEKCRIFGIEQDGYFIDIGVPEDYQKAQEDLK